MVTKEAETENIEDMETKNAKEVGRENNEEVERKVKGRTFSALLSRAPALLCRRLVPT